MKRKKAYLIINPKEGENVAKLTDMLAVFSAADWKTDIALKEFGGHTEQLAREAAEDGYDLVISYGGDGTLNHVINGIMAAKNHSTIVGVIPGGTANVWAHEIGIPKDPVKASLLLVNSEGRKVDLGRVEVDSPSLPGETKEKKKRPRSEGGQHFLLMAGLGVDAAIMSRVSAPLKEKVGQEAVAIAAVKRMPSQRPFPIEIRSAPPDKEEGMLWKGEALQVIVGNTRRYGNIAEATPEAYIDDGVLDVCVITAGDPLNTFEQILSTLLHRAPVEGRSEYFKGAHFWISVPASIDLQLDGSLVKRKDREPAADSVASPKEGELIVMSTYRFDAMPRAMSAAIPFTYDQTLFENGSGAAKALATEPDPDQEAVQVEVEGAREDAHQSPEQVATLLDHGQTVNIVGVGPNPERKGTYIIAGGVSDQETGESKPVAVCIDRDTALVRPAGDPLPSTFPTQLPEGGVIVVEGKESKRGVIRATRVVVMNGSGRE